MRKLKIIGDHSFATRQFNRCIFSASLMTMLDFLMIFLNSIIVGNIVGPNGLSAINLVNPIAFFVEFVSATIGIGTSYLYNQAIGAADKKKASQLWGQGVILSVFSGIMLAALAIIIRGAYLSFFYVDESVMAEVQGYYRFMLLNCLIEPFYYLLYEMVFMDGDETLSLVANLVHIPLQLLLLVLLCRKMGTGGAALAIFISMLISLGLFSIHFFRKCNTMHFCWFLSLSSVWKIVTISLTDAVVNLCWMGTQFIMNKFTLLQFGPDYLPAFSIICSVFELCLFFDGIGEAFAPIANVYIGEKNYKPLNHLFFYSLKIALVESCVVGVLLFVTAPLFPALYNITDPVIAQVVVRGLRILAFGFPGIAVVFDISSVYVMTERIGLAVLMAMTSNFLGNIPTAFLLLHLFGSDVLALSYCLAPLFSLLVFIPILRAYDNSLVKPWLTPKQEENMFYVDGAGDVEEIMQMRDAIGDFLNQNGKADRAFTVMLLVEELSMLIVEKNRKKIYLEYTIKLDGNDILVSEHDSGILFDILSEDSPISQFRSYFVSLYLQTIENKRHMVSIGLNRNMFKF